MRKLWSSLQLVSGEFIRQHDAKIMYRFEVLCSIVSLVSAKIIHSLLFSVKRPGVCQAEITNLSVRGGRMKRKMQSYAQQTSLDG